mmetsp:Transcript_5870/g.15353  ORF Transcript_5870/g.15353 Transcript_5870/m.15353 type:complete len:209 (-) Transcript_5870:564-1190(-)
MRLCVDRAACAVARAYRVRPSNGLRCSAARSQAARRVCSLTAHPPHSSRSAAVELSAGGALAAHIPPPPAAPCPYPPPPTAMGAPPPTSSSLCESARPSLPSSPSPSADPNCELCSADGTPERLASVEFQRFLTWLSVRPGSRRAIRAQQLPSCECARRMVSSSSDDQLPRLIPVFSWLHHRSRHCLPVRPGSCCATRLHLRAPCSAT